MRKRHDWASVQRAHDGGLTPAECRQRFCITCSAWSMAIRRGRLRAGACTTDGRRRYDWSVIQAYYHEGHSFRECAARFGFSTGAWQKAVSRGEMQPRPLGRGLSELLLAGKARSNIKRRLLAAGLLKAACSECGLYEWLGERLTAQIDHINGVRDDYRLENLRMLCPNCHSQTPTYGKRNARRPCLQERPEPV